MQTFSKTNRFFLLLLSLSFGSLPAWAQTGTLAGRVTTADGQPVPFASVSVRNTNRGTSTDKSGVFSLDRVPAGSQTVLISAMSFRRVERAVSIRENETERLDLVLEAQADDLGEVVVTASRRAENASEVPSSITIVNQRQIREQLAVNPDITSLLQYTVPGLGYFTGRTSNVGQTLRGRQVLVLIDGVPQSTPLRNGGRDLRIIDPSAIERIEVIKGATSIYGNGADGGIINYITKRPEGTRPLAAQTWLGLSSGLTHAAETQGYRLSQQLTGRTAKLDYVLNGTLERTGLMKDATGAVLSPFYNTGDMNTYNLLAKLGYTVSPRQRVELMYNFYGSESKLRYVERIGKFGQTPTIGVPAPGEIPGTPQGTPYNHNLTARYTHDRLLGGTGLEVMAYSQNFRTVYGYDAQFFEGGGQSNIVSNKKGVRLNLNTPLRLGKNLSGEWLYGLDLLSDQTAQKLQDGRFWTPDMAMTNLAPYAQLKLDFFEKLILKAGARYENIGVDVSDFTTLRTYNATTKAYDGGVAVQGGTLDYRALVGNIGLRYAGSTLIQPFVSFSQAFSINELGRILRTSQRSIISQLPTEPIIVDNYEAGLAGAVGTWLRYEVAYFQSRSELGASFRQLPSGVFEIVRAPEKIEGVEFSLDLTPLRGLSLGGTYSFVEGWADNTNSGEFATYLGSDRIMAPKTTAYVRVNPGTRGYLTLSALHAGVREPFQPNARGGYTYGQGPVAAYTLVNLSGGYQLSPAVSLALGVENLFNIDYFPAISQWSARDADYIKGTGARGTLTLQVKF